MSFGETRRVWEPKVEMLYILTLTQIDEQSLKPFYVFSVMLVNTNYTYKILDGSKEKVMPC